MDLQQSAEIALTVPLRYAQAGSSLAHAALAGAQEFEVLRHYPEADVVDAGSRSRFYYHAHRLDGAEHGHFHLFTHGDRPGDFFHLVALSLDANGQPLQWFCTNRWVTGEQWRSAAEVVTALRRFSVTTAGRLSPVARWISAMVRLFGSELQDLVEARDREMNRLMASGAYQTLEQLWEDRAVDILCHCDAALVPKIQAVESSLEDHATHAG